MKRQMPRSAILPHLARWFETPTPPNTFVLVYTEDRRSAIDGAQKLAQLVQGPFTAITVQFDDAPTCVGRIGDDFRVYFVTQPDHIQTVIWSQKAEPMSVWRSRMKRVDTDLVAKTLGLDNSGAGTPFDYVDRSDLLAVGMDSANLATAMKRDGFEPPRVRKPLQIIVDAEHPHWPSILQLAGKGNHVIETSRVPPHHTLLATTERAMGRASAIMKDL